MTEVVVKLSDDAREQLEKIAAEKGVSLEQILADALDLEVTYAQIKSQGGRLLFEKEGHVQELTPA